ncbi:MAG: peptidoglycan DD-metalloendopeptidase family protein [Gammaproteobacteria bacterium]|nr:peptidoglycan DD-metalloendopeptidase family protein [Gammaproteobacteria bacterium]
MNSLHRQFSVLLIASCSLLLASCGGGYQAPISELGEQQVISAPEVFSSNSEAGGTQSQPIQRGSISSGVGGTGSNLSSSNINRAGPASHLVRPGDTLFSIAFQYDLDFRSLAIANGLNPPYTIFVDQEINLDLNNIVRGGSAVSTANLGTAVGNNSVARSRAGGGTSGSVLRQPVTSTPRAISWQWPHQGRLVRGFQSGVSKGLDISGNVGDAVLAAGDGDVVYSGRGIQGSGDLIIIRHSDRYLSAYAHNSRMLVNEGSRVRAGEKIAEVGENSSGVAMLHFEIREAGDSVDPSRLLPSK